MSNPKLFISYSWTTPEHEMWVLDLASELVESGVEVILDKWDLKEGHDAHAFMERMVTDPEIKKVLLICDKAYTDKANGRSGGVGTEAQIISGEIYAKQDQEKFVAVVRERSEAGEPYVPAYYKSRIFVDLSDPTTYADNFEKLLRWIYDKPLYVKPQLGAKPAFLSEAPSSPLLGTTASFKRAVAAVKDSRPHAAAAVSEYLVLFATELEKLRIERDDKPFDDSVVKSIEAFLPFRNQAVELFLTLASYQDTPDTRLAVHRFFESLIPYLDRPEGATSWGEWDSDNFRFIVHELFLYALASFVHYERFETAAYLVANDYYVPGRSDYGKGVMVGYPVFQTYMRSLDARNLRLELGRLSLRADLLKERSAGVGLAFREIMQVDFIVFLRNAVEQRNEPGTWFPETLIYSYSQGPFELFARSRSASYFERAKVLLGVEDITPLQEVMDNFRDGIRRIPRWHFESFNPSVLINIDELATKP